MSSPDPVFVDTNVLVFASRPKADEHEIARCALARLRQDAKPLWLSRQVLREYLAASTRPQRSDPAFSMAEAIADVQRFRSGFNIASSRPGSFDTLLQLLSDHPGSGKQVHDANLVASMMGEGVARLLTFNASDFRRFEPAIEIVVP